MPPADGDEKGVAGMDVDFDDIGFGKIRMRSWVMAEQLHVAIDMVVIVHIWHLHRRYQPPFFGAVELDEEVVGKVMVKGSDDAFGANPQEDTVQFLAGVEITVADIACVGQQVAQVGVAEGEVGGGEVEIVGLTRIFHHVDEFAEFYILAVVVGF